MERLPYIDEHARDVDAGREQTWAALLRRWGSPVGFRVDEATAPERLALSGRHPFARYRLVFDLEEVDAGRTRLRARSWAAFPGPHGRAYRALVVGTGLHRVAVRVLLHRIAARA